MHNNNTKNKNKCKKEIFSCNVAIKYQCQNGHV